MKVIVKAVDSFIRVLMGSSALVLFVVTFLQVVFRFMLRTPLAWSQDVIRFCFTYLVFIGAAYCVREKAHLNIDVFISSLPNNFRKILELIINLLISAFFVFLVYYGYAFALSGKTQLAPYLPIPMFYYYLSVPISAALMLFYIIFQLIEQTADLTSKGGEK